MQNNSKKTIIIAIVSVLILVGLGTVFVKGIQGQRQSQKRLVSGIEEAKPLEDEVLKLKQQIDDNRRKNPYESDYGILAIGYQISTAEDVTLIQEQSQDYSFTPVIIFDMANDMEELTEQIQAVSDREWEYMFTQTPFDEETFEKVNRCRELLEKTNMVETNSFLLRGNDDRQENIDRIKECGFTSCTRYTNGVGPGSIVMNLNVYEYSFLTTDGQNLAHLLARFDTMEANHYHMLLVFSMKSYHEHSLSNTGMREIFDSASRLMTDGNVAYGKINEINTEIDRKVSAEVQYEITNAEEEARLLKEIEELESKIQAIYDKWE